MLYIPTATSSNWRLQNCMACVSHQQLSRMRSFCCCRPPCPCHLSSLSSAINVKDRRYFRCNSVVNPLFITGLPSNVEQELNTHWSQFRFITLVCPSLTNIWASPPIMSFECSYNFAPPGVIKLFWKIFFNKSWNTYPRCIQGLETWHVKQGASLRQSLFCLNQTTERSKV